MTPQDLNNSILQLAIQGKLVEQREDEGTAEELYEQIQAEKKKLIAEGKIKKEKKLPEITEDEILFEIPKSWKWVYLDDVVAKNIKRGKSPKYTESSKVLVFAQKCNVKTGGINLKLAKCLDESVLEKYPVTEYMMDEDIIINSTGTGTMGRVGFYHTYDNTDDYIVVPDSHVTIIRTSPRLSREYVYYYVKSFQSYLENMGEGSTKQKELKPLTIRRLMMALPPLAEQKRIVAKIEELLPYCDRLK